MINIKENVSLKPYNTFGLEASARYFVEVSDTEALKDVLQHPLLVNQRKLFLGGGSNILLLNDFDGVVIKIGLKGKEIVSETADFAIIKAGAGEIWHEFVLFCIDHNLGGVENMSLIPGTVGAAPMQNIGAYGAEVKDTFHQLEALNLESLEVETFDAEKCAFGYRESFFKHEGKGKYVILNVSFKLSKHPELNVSYGAIRQTLQETGISHPTLRDVSNAVIHIRRSKLPDPAEIGNSGSFFKNPEIPEEEYLKIREKYPDIPGYEVSDTQVKVPAGWLIEQAGWKGRRVGPVGVHDRQALVLVHFGGGEGQAIADLAARIQASVSEKFGITITPEVNFIR
ncbi:MAG: UDP-N-acetylmuramate dehydrogenase [Leadbetterella sp.]|nr:UDP-N-acetylmuramate dehydrogenase [Leadbetterella sp.]